MKELEWEQVRNLVSKYIGSPLGAADLAKLEPSSNRPRLERDLPAHAEALSTLAPHFQPRRLAFRDAPGSQSVAGRRGGRPATYLARAR